MKQLLAVLLALSISTFCFAQGFQWAKKAGGNEADYGRDVVVDNSGNYYVCGRIAYKTSGSYTATFGSLSITNSSRNGNGYLVKYDSNGNAIWTKDLESAEEVNATDLAVDNNGNIFVAGEIDSSVTIDGVTVTCSFSNSGGVFLAKFQSDGTLIWLKSLEATVPISIGDLIVDANGDAWLTGYTDDWYFYLRKYSGNNGTLINNVQSVNSPSAYPRGESLAIDNLNNIIVAGEFGGDFSLGSLGVTGFPFALSDDMFIAKFDNNATPLWLTHGGTDNGQDIPIGIGIDQANNIYISSYTSDSVIWNNQVVFVKTNGSWSERYFLKFASNGNLIWTKSVPINFTSIGRNVRYPLIGNKIVFNVDAYSDTINIGGTQFSSTGDNALIVLADTSLNFVGAYEIVVNSIYDPEIAAIAVDQNNDILITGYLRDLVTFGTIPVNSTGGNKADMYLAKLNPCVISAIATNPSGSVSLCQGSGILISSDTIAGGSYQWYLNNTPISNATASTYTATQPGTYNVIASIGGGCQSESNAIVVSSSSINAQIQSQSGVTSVCQGSTLQLQTTSVYTSYAWSTGQNGVSAITIGAGYHSVIVTDFNGCVDTAYITISEFPQTQQPQVIKSSCLLTSDITPAGASYKWWFDKTGSGYQVVGSNNSAYNAMTTGDGLYKVELTDQNSCKSMSNPIAVTGCGTSVNDMPFLAELDLFPNPSNGVFTISFKSESINQVEIAFLNLLGEKIYENHFVLSNGDLKTELNLSSVAKGLYLVRIIANSKSVYRKIIISN